MEFSPTYAIDVPYEQKAAVVSAASQETIEQENIRINNTESGIQVYRVYFDTQPSETTLFFIKPASGSKSEVVANDVNNERLELLAEKYVDKQWSREKEARLQIDHQKVERLYPSVTREQLDKIDEIRQKFKESGDAIDQELRDLGII